ncbi:MAG: SOS response-associated peptidase [Gammaproteobacteria bacterium]|nr:SOS response-associated peptidase [Gammaproteobacteria bacterium]
MSGRYSLHHLPPRWLDCAGDSMPAFAPRWNIAPDQQVLLLRQRGDTVQLTPALWGFTPAWSKDFSQVVTHARTENLAGQRFFADALATRRGVLPATGFYEWRGQARTRKQPYWLSRQGELLYMAALWEPYVVAEQEYLSVALLTVQAAYLRRPLLLAEADLALWMDPATPVERIQVLLAGSGLALQERKVSTRVNDPLQDGPECIRPV